MESLHGWFLGHGFSEAAANIAMIVVAVLASLAIGGAVRLLAHIPLSRLFQRSKSWHDALRTTRMPARIGWVVVTLAANELVVPLLEPWPRASQVVDRLIGLLLVMTIAVALSGLIATVVVVFQHHKAQERLPVKVLGQALQMVVWTYAGVASLTVLTGKDVASVLTGLTAIGAVLVYVFRDPILGWTASVQIAANDLLREGDWISVPQRNADGEVEEISMTTVKVRNWDKTISSIPTYALFSEGFQNWRGMYESGGRRIKRSIRIDTTSVTFCDEDLVRRAGVEVDSSQVGADPLNGPSLTNLGVFRRWLAGWLKKHPDIKDGMTSMVRELAPDGRGVPVEIYVFSSDQRWEYYEKLQADIVDQVLAVLPQFDLRLYQDPTGDDLRVRAGDGASS